MKTFILLSVSIVSTVILSTTAFANYYQVTGYGTSDFICSNGPLQCLVVRGDCANRARNDALDEAKGECERSGGYTVNRGEAFNVRCIGEFFRGYCEANARVRCKRD